MKKTWVKALVIILVTIGLMGISLLGVYYVMNERTKELEKQVLELEQELNTRYTETELNFKITQSVDEACEDTRTTMLHDIKEMLIETNSSIKTIRHYYPEDLVVVSGGKFHFLPIRDDLKKHNYDESKLNFADRNRHCAAFCADDGGRIREYGHFVRHVVRTLHRTAAHVGGVPRRGGSGAPISLGRHPPRVQETEKHCPHVGHYL